MAAAASWTVVKQKQQQEPEVRRIAVPQPEEDHKARCARCRQPFLNGVPPWQDYCSHRFCDPCFDNLSNRHSLCPACKREGESYEVGSNMHFRDKSFQRIRGLKAKCSFDPPCGWVGDFSQLREHESFCENRKFCCYHCGARVIWRLMDDHVTNECRHRRVTCRHCQFETKYSSIIDHVRNDCPFYYNVALRQQFSNCKDEVKQGLWILQMVVYTELDSRRHLSIAENSNLVTKNGIQVAEETQDEVNVGKVEMGSSQGSKETEKELAIERNDVEDNVSNEHEDLAWENKTLEPANKVINVPVQKFKGNVEITQEIEVEILEYRPNSGEENEEKIGNEKLVHNESQTIIKNNDEICRNDSFSGSRYLTSRAKHDTNGDETNFLASNKSTEPASQETKRKKKKNKKKKVDDKDGGEHNCSMIDSKVEQNMFHSIEICCSKLKACQEKVDVLERAMEVLMRELERQANTNSLLVKLMRDQHKLEGRVNAVEERQNFG